MIDTNSPSILIETGHAQNVTTRLEECRAMLETISGKVSEDTSKAVSGVISLMDDALSELDTVYWPCDMTEAAFKASIEIRRTRLTMSVGAFDAACNRIRSVKAILGLIQSEMIGEAPNDALHRNMSRALDGAIELCGAAADTLDAGTDNGKKVSK
ncbi:MAG: hypothetical protein IJR48_08960 [Oscillibacter sp.]|nr:hypothetical protein [Oscillibacter sp.]